MRMADRIANVDETPQHLAELERMAGKIGRGRLARRGRRRFAAVGCVGIGKSVSVKPLDGPFERLAANEFHGVERPTVGILAQAIDGHDARMFQPPGDLGFLNEALPAGRIVGIAG